MASHPKNIFGQRFGKLVAIKMTAEKRGTNIVWECQCDCGNITKVRCTSLISGNTKSCGHCPRYEDISGQRFGKLVAIKYIGKNKWGSNTWECKCDCGNITSSQVSMLKCGHVKSCGCYNRESASIRLTSLLTKHGLSNTKEYNLAKAKVRKEMKKLHDSEWTPEMEYAIRQLFTACIFCGSTDKLAVDHVLPLSKGYGLKPGNAVILCKSCNSKKHDKDINTLSIEWQTSLIWNAFKFKDHWESILMENNKPIKNQNIKRVTSYCELIDALADTYHSLNGDYPDLKIRIRSILEESAPEKIYEEHQKYQ